MSAAGSTVELSRPEPAIALVTIRNERRANSLTPAMSYRLGDIWDEIAGDRAVRATVVTGEGERTFCAGNDVTATPPVDDPAWSFAGLDRLARVETPTIAAINGAAIGGGLELALACDIRIAATGATFGLPEPRLGLIAGVGGTQRLPRLIGRGPALHLLLTGAPIDVDAALRWGLVTGVSEPARLHDDALALARGMAALGPVALRATKRAVAEGLDLPLSDALALESRLARRVAEGPEADEGRAAFQARREPDFSDEGT